MSNLCNKRSRAFSPMSQQQVGVLSDLTNSLKAFPKLDLEDQNMIRKMISLPPAGKENINPNAQTALPVKSKINRGRHDSLRGLVVEVEGNIGSGKSTLLNKMHQYFNGQPGENMCEKFGEIVNNDFLGAFYSQPKKYGFAFQMYMLTTRLYQMQESARQAHDENRLCFLDRGAVGDSLFAILSHENGNMDDQDMMVYKSVCHERFPKTLSTNVDAVMYLDVDPLECHRRVLSVRKNKAEEGIPVEYLDSVDGCYFDLLMTWMGGRKGTKHDMNVGPPPKVLVLDWNKFGSTENALDELVKIVDGERPGPKVDFVDGNLTPNNDNYMKCLDSREAIEVEYTRIKNLQERVTLAPGRERVAVNWNLTRDNTFRRVVNYWLARDAHVHCFDNEA